MLSTSPFTYTRLPLLVIVAMAVGLVFAAGPDAEGLVLLAVTAGVAYIAMRALPSDYADKVYDGGDHLIVRIGREEERIFLTNIERVELHGRRPPYIQLHLNFPGKFGREIAFLPAGLFTDPSWNKPAVFTELDDRVRAAHAPPESLK